MFDLVIRAGTVHTIAENDGSSPNTIAIRDGVIAKLGDAAAFDEWSASATRSIDLGTATLVPGLVDNHIHPIFGIGLAQGPDLTNCLTEEAVVAALREHQQTLGSGDWLFGWGLDLNIAEPGKLSNAFLDELVGDRPAFLRLKDAHSGLASTAALRIAGYAEDSPLLLPANPGWLVELEAMGPISEAIPPMSVDEKAQHMHVILDAMASRGFTEGFVMDFGDPDTFEILRRAEAIRPLSIRLRISPWVMPDNQAPTVDDVIAMQGLHGDRWEIAGVKLMIDGTIDNGTAWLYEPDTKGESTASMWLDTTAYRAAMAKLHAAGIGTSTHAIGDKGIDFVAETIAALPAGGPRHRIEHIETVTEDVIAMMRDANITASMQPTHCTHFLFADASDNWSIRLGHDRAARGFRWADIRDAGVNLVIGSDWPVAICDAPQIFASAQLRRPAGSESKPINRANQTLTALDVLKGMTSYTDASVERTPRQIAVGYPATFTAFRDDPLTTDPDAFAETEVVLTTIDGAVVVGA